MLKKLLLFIGFLISTQHTANAFALIPPNDSANHAIDLGPLAAPGLCPTNPKGAYDSLTGTTIQATFSAEYFSLYHCYTSGSPDVWYKFQATGSFIYVELTGLSGFSNFFLKIHYSQGSSITLLPGQCVTSTGNILTATFPTPTLNGEYYLQIGGDSPTNTGDFFMKYKAFNDCDGCVKTATMNFSPAPVFGRYNPGDTVTMCTTVDRWQSLTTSYIHGIVPEFGTDWDISTLTPVSAPIPQSANGSWGWFSNINTPAGNLDGFFFDFNNDGDPTNNHGDNGPILATWTGCWRIVAQNQCTNADLGVRIHLYSDDETGNGNSFSVCNPYDILEVNTSSSCCLAPDVVTFANGGCSSFSSTIVVTPQGTSSVDTMNYYLLTDSHAVVQQYNNAMGSVTFSSVPPGDYVLWSVDVSNGFCTSYVAIHVEQPLNTSVIQTATGCGSGTGSALATVISGGLSPYTYFWINVNAVNQNDSVAFNLQDGWVYVQITDAAGCTTTDSVFITSQSYPDTWFTYGGGSACANADTIHVSSQPASHSGIFSLVSPIGFGITVNPANGDVFLNNTTHSLPFYLYVSYSINGPCPASYVDSVLIVAPPAAPVATGPMYVGYCIGATAPTLSVTVPFTAIGYWYDLQTSQAGIGNSFTPPLSSSTAPGNYYYTVASVDLNCASSLVLFTVNATAPPVITVSADQYICEGDTATLSVNGNGTITYQWYPAPTIGSATTMQTTTSPASTTMYSVTATDAVGCSTMAYLNVYVQNCDTVPVATFYNGLTPNGDGHNDTWIIDNIDSISHNHVSIFNRWGVLVWEGFNYDNSIVVFRGNDFNGHQLADGTYFFTLTGDHTTGSGWIELSAK